MAREQLHVRIEAEDLQQLATIAAREGVAVSHIVRRLIRLYLSQRGHIQVTPTDRVSAQRPETIRV